MKKRLQFTTTLKTKTLAQLREIAVVFDRNRNDVIEVLVGSFHSRSFQKALKDYQVEHKSRTSK